MNGRLVLAAVAALATLAIGTTTAHAASCTPVLVDGEGYEWVLQNTGAVGHPSASDAGDAFDTYGTFIVNGNSYPALGPDSCEHTEGGREVSYPTLTVMGSSDLEFSRQVFVPTDGGFARWLDTIANNDISSITLTVRFEGDLGSDNGTRITGSSSGNSAHEAADSWLTSDDGLAAQTDNAVSQVFDSTLTVPDRLDTVSDQFAGDSIGAVDYTNVTLHGGQKVVFMHFAAQNGALATADAIADAQRLARGSVAGYSNISEADLSRLLNFPPVGDEDGDGVFNDTDNCVSVASSDQTDTDADGAGNACDADDDNDGLSDSVETGLGTNPLDADSDNDGVNDGADQCPKTVGDQANGCTSADAPPTVSFMSPPENATLSPDNATTLQVAADDDSGVAHVLFADDGQVLCTDSTAPYECPYQPQGDDIGANTLTAIAVDNADQTATASLPVTVEKFTSVLTLRVRPRRDEDPPFKFVAKGRLKRGEVLTAEEACNGLVKVKIKDGKKKVFKKTVPVNALCKYKTKAKLKAKVDGKLKVRAKFLGNDVLKRDKAPKRTVKAG